MMAKAPKPPVLQVLFEPFADLPDYTWDREGGEAFAGLYWLDALEPDGSFKVRGYRMHMEGCSGCRRADGNPRAHWDMRNDHPGRFAPKKARRCGKWQMIESIVKNFGGWQRVHYVELPAYEGITWQPIPQRKRWIIKCPACGGTGLGPMNPEALSAWYETRSKADRDRIFPPCDAGCGSYGYRSKGEVLVTYEGPVRPDRFGMTPEQRRIRRPAEV
jgi:hypothetical protein